MNEEIKEKITKMQMHWMRGAGFAEMKFMK